MTGREQEQYCRQHPPFGSIQFSLDGPFPIFMNPTVKRGKELEVFLGENNFEPVHTIDSKNLFLDPNINVFEIRKIKPNYPGDETGFLLHIWREEERTSHYHLLLGPELRGEWEVLNNFPQEIQSELVQEMVALSPRCFVSPHGLELFIGDTRYLALTSKGLKLESRLRRNGRPLDTQGEWVGKFPQGVPYRTNVSSPPFYFEVMGAKGNWLDELRERERGITCVSGVQFCSVDPKSISKQMEELIKTDKADESHFRQIVNPYFRLEVSPPVETG